MLDEADTMCDMGFLPDVRRILTHLPERRQTLFFAATMPDEIRGLSNEILDRPTTVQIGIIAPAKTVSHALYPVTDGVKKRLLVELLDQTATGRVMIFTRTKHRARRLARDLENSRYRVAALQGNMSQNRRQQSINGFRDGQYDLLVATDVASRGIDVSAVSHVINFDMPNTVDAYIHRIGRTGRAELTGEAYTFVMPEDETLVRKIEAVLGTRIERRRLPDFDYGSPRHDAQASKGRPATTACGYPTSQWPSGSERYPTTPERKRPVRCGFDTNSTERSGQPKRPWEATSPTTQPRRPGQRREVTVESTSPCVRRSKHAGCLHIGKLQT